MVVQLKDEDFEEFRKISDKEGIKYKTDAEMRESARNLVNLVELLVEMEHAERMRKQRLEIEPKGYSMPGDGRMCSLCGHIVHDSDGWYDKWGFKCMNCQKAVNKRLIPGSLCGDYKHEKYISDSGLSHKANLHVQTIRKLIRNNKIKARQIPNGPYLILRKDNPNILDVLRAEQENKEAKSAQR